MALSAGGDGYARNQPKRWPEFTLTSDPHKFTVSQAYLRRFAMKVVLRAAFFGLCYFALFTFSPMEASAHGGRLNKCGCHRDNSTNPPTCHCHRAPYGGCGPECYASATGDNQGFAQACDNAVQPEGRRQRAAGHEAQPGRDLRHPSPQVPAPRQTLTLPVGVRVPTRR